jgi:hypothetical protein
MAELRGDQIGLSSAVNLLLPEGLSRDQKHSLARKLVHALGANAATPDTDEGAAPSSSDYVTLSELGGSPPDDRPILNDSTWVLTVPTSRGVDAVQRLIRAIPEAVNVEVEEVVRHGIADS